MIRRLAAAAVVAPAFAAAGALIEAGGGAIDAAQIDQSALSHLERFDSLAGSNAQATFEEMEWE